MSAMVTVGFVPLTSGDIMTEASDLTHCTTMTHLVLPAVIEVWTYSWSLMLFGLEGTVHVNCNELNNPITYLHTWECVKLS